MLLITVSMVTVGLHTHVGTLVSSIRLVSFQYHFTITYKSKRKSSLILSPPPQLSSLAV